MKIRCKWPGGGSGEWGGMTVFCRPNLYWKTYRSISIPIPKDLGRKPSWTNLKSSFTTLYWWDDTLTTNQFFKKGRTLNSFNNFTLDWKFQSQDFTTVWSWNFFKHSSKILGELWLGGGMLRILFPSKHGKISLLQKGKILELKLAFETGKGLCTLWRIGNRNEKKDQNVAN